MCQKVHVDACVCRDKSADRPSVKRVEKKKKKKERLGEFPEGEGEEEPEGRWEKVKGGVPLVKVNQ